MARTARRRPRAWWCCDPSRVAGCYVNNNSSLKLAADIANTRKHSERRPGDRACSITGAKIHPAGAVVTFTWTDAQGGSRHEDCLDLAERAVNAWSAFLRSHNL